MNIVNITAPEGSAPAETGLIQFNGELPGVIIKPQDAAYFAQALAQVLNGGPAAAFSSSILGTLLALLNGPLQVLQEAQKQAAEAAEKAANDPTPLPIAATIAEAAAHNANVHGVSADDAQLYRDSGGALGTTT